MITREIAELAAACEEFDAAGATLCDIQERAVVAARDWEAKVVAAHELLKAASARKALAHAALERSVRATPRPELPTLPERS